MIVTTSHDPARRSRRSAPRRSTAPHVDVCIQSPWAAETAITAVRGAGAIPCTRCVDELLDTPKNRASALVYDLGPSNAVACAVLAAESTSPRPLLFYLQPKGDVFSLLSSNDVPDGAPVQIQSRDAESLHHLSAAMTRLVGAVPQVRILRLLAALRPRTSTSALLTSRSALQVLGAGRRPSVNAIAKRIGVTPRTLQRRLGDEVGPPKGYFDWLTVAHITCHATTHNLSQARVASRLGLSSNDLYRLRCRVFKRDAHRWARLEPILMALATGRSALSPTPHAD